MRFFGTDTEMEKVEMLKGVHVFRELSRTEILEVEELLYERTYEQGEIVYGEGDPGHGIFIVISGKLRVQTGRELLKAANLEFGPGELVGELCLFDEAPRTATVVAAERTVAVALFQAEFSSLLTKNKSIGVKILVEITRTLSQRARQLLLGEKHVPVL
jgi:CRP/FNR family cyclic AMP-dependent transcriptional regulator